MKLRMPADHLENLLRPLNASMVPVNGSNTSMAITAFPNGLKLKLAFRTTALNRMNSPNDENEMMLYLFIFASCSWQLAICPEF